VGVSNPLPKEKDGLIRGRKRKALGCHGLQFRVKANISNFLGGAKKKGNFGGRKKKTGTAKRGGEGNAASEGRGKKKRKKD